MKFLNPLRIKLIEIYVFTPREFILISSENSGEKTGVIKVTI